MEGSLVDLGHLGLLTLARPLLTYHRNVRNDGA
jgi:hypothetical protein